MQKLTVSIKPHNAKPNVGIITFEGDFDGYAKENIVDVQKMIDESKPGTTLIFDFAKLNFLNSYAIGHLVAWHNHLVKNGGKIMIASLNKNVEDIFGILGIASLFKIFPDVASAEAAA